MHRLFVAIRPPREVRSLLCAAMGDIQGARWEADERLHLTLRFIGAVDAMQGEDIVSALRQIRADRFELTLGDSGTFATKGCVHTLWAGVRQSALLSTLRTRIDRAIDAVVPTQRTRAYVPHVTLARFGRREPWAVPFRLPTFLPASFTVQNFQLFESTLTKDAPVYTMVEKYELG